MKTFLRDNWIPVAISAAALVVATAIGLVPVLRSDDSSPSSTEAGLQRRVADLEAKVFALEAASQTPDTGQQQGIDPALRAEIDQIVKGLVNQTGRISRLKKELAPVLAWGDTPPVPERVEQQIKLIDRALLKQTGRIKTLQQDVAPIVAWGDTPPVPKRVEQQISLIDKALLKQTGRIKTLQNDIAPVTRNTSAIDRLSLQVKNLESAVTQLHKRIRKVSDDLESSAVRADATSPDTLQSIEQKLDDILKSVKAQ